MSSKSKLEGMGGRLVTRQKYKMRCRTVEKTRVKGRGRIVEQGYGYN